jgi:hypothetical protein
MKTQLNEVTRLLCAAVYRNYVFRKRLIEMIDENYRAIPFSPGINIIPILKHAVIASELSFAEILAFFLLFIPSMIVVLIEREQLSIVFVFIFVTISSIISLSYKLKRRKILTLNLSKEKFNENIKINNLDDKTEQCISDSQIAQNGNVTIYSAYSPFIGFGDNLGGWSFVIDITKPQTINKITEGFTINELYQYVDCELNNLGIELKNEDRLFVNGQKIRNDERFLPYRYDRPNSNVPLTVLAEYIAHPDDNIRYYKCYYSIMWGGELVLSVFIRFQFSGKYLFIEVNNYLLTPLNEFVHAVDSISKKTTFRQWSGLIGEAVFMSPLKTIFSPLILSIYVIDYFGRKQNKKEIRKNIDEDLLFNYGAKESIREFANTGLYYQHFQRSDKEKIYKILERTILDSLITFLDNKNVDTSDIKDRKTVIMNHGVIVSGGELKAENIAVGEKAKVTHRKENV